MIFIPFLLLISASGPPDQVRNCSVTNYTSSSLRVECEEGYDGGLQQKFYLEVYNAIQEYLEKNLTRLEPIFAVQDIPSSTEYLLVIYSANMKGRSSSVVIKGVTEAGPRSESDVIQKRAAFYIANETMCIVDGAVYRNGDPVPSDDECERCTCRPPGFACVLRDCDTKPGCKAVRRVGECCPEYVCGCVHNSRHYEDGELIKDLQNNCYTCRCQGSSISCTFPDCPFRSDCPSEYIPGECCPRYDNCPSESIYSQFECMVKERSNCDASLLPTNYPNTTEELQTICSNVKTFGNCMLRVHESCGYDGNELESMQRGQRFVNTVCEEDNPINKVISRNLNCISPIARKVEEECKKSSFTEENYEAVNWHEEYILENYNRTDIIGCLTPLWEVQCRSIIVGFHCGSEVREAVQDLLTGVNSRFHDECTHDILQKLEPLTETYKVIIEAEQGLKSETQKRR